MTDVADGQKFPGRNWLDSLSHEDSIHHNTVAGRQVYGGELVLGGHIGFQNVLASVPFNGFGSFQV